MARQEPGAILVRHGDQDIAVPAITAAELGLTMNQRIDAQTAMTIAARKKEIVEVMVEIKRERERER